LLYLYRSLPIDGSILLLTLLPLPLLAALAAGRGWSLKPSLTLGSSLILGPAFFSAWAYTILGYCITRLGSAYSLLKPKWYLITFVSADIISLVLQAIGGGRAAVAAKLGTNTHTATQISECECASARAERAARVVRVVRVVPFVDWEDERAICQVSVFVSHHKPPNSLKPRKPLIPLHPPSCLTSAPPS
jgi:hypothetical protein